MEILIYQFVIAGIIVISAIIKGKVGLNWVSCGVVAWTVFHIFVPWLMLIQFITIAIAYGIGNAIVGEE